MTSVTCSCGLLSFADTICSWVLPAFTQKLWQRNIAHQANKAGLTMSLDLAATPHMMVAAKAEAKGAQLAALPVHLISGETISVEGLFEGSLVRDFRKQFEQLKPPDRYVRYQLLQGTRFLLDEERLDGSHDITAVARLQPAVVGASKILEVTEDGSRSRMTRELDGQDYGWLCYEAIPEDGCLTWRVTAVNFTGATGIGITTNKEDIDDIPGKHRPGVHIEYRRSGSTRFYNEGEYPFFRKHSEIRSGDTIELKLDVKLGTLEISKDGSTIVSFEHSEAMPIKGFCWHPCIIFDEAGEEAIVNFGKRFVD